MNQTFTPQQISDWKAYERVRSVGKWNMYDPRARMATGMSGDRYSFTMQNYSELKMAANPEKPAEHGAE